jgi:hypothetical protein
MFTVYAMTQHDSSLSAVLHQLLPGRSIGIECVSAYCSLLAKQFRNNNIDLMSPITITQNNTILDADVRSLIDSVSLFNAVKNNEVNCSDVYIDNNLNRNLFYR